MHVQGIGLEAEDGTSLGIEQFLTLLVHLAFYRDNPRYAPQMAGAPKMTQETVPVLQTVQNLMNEFLPKMKQGTQKEFSMVLKGARRGGGRPTLTPPSPPSPPSHPHHLTTLAQATRRRRT